MNTISVSGNDYPECPYFLFSVIQALIKVGQSFLKVVSFMRDFTVCINYACSEMSK